MKNSEKSSSKQVNNVNNEVLSPENIKAQLKAACANMTAKETKDYIKGLDGYELKLTGQKPTQHYTVFFGDVRICNVEQVQGIKADGTSRGCTSTVKVNFIDKINNIFSSYVEKIKLTDDEKNAAAAAFESAFDNLQKVQSLFDIANERAANEAKKAAKAAAFNKKVEKKAEELSVEDIEKQMKILQAALAKKRA